jgi:hypothetical protein
LKLKNYGGESVFFVPVRSDVRRNKAPPFIACRRDVAVAASGNPG